jgi:tetratricopeptide (TPR) repeat protein
LNLRCLAEISAVFAVVFLTHVLSPVILADSDTSWSIHTALSLIREGDTDLDEYESLFLLNRERFAIRVDGHIYNQWPEGPSLISVPLVYLIDVACDVVLGVDLHEYIGLQFPGRIERFIASLYVALAAVFIHLMARRSLSLPLTLAVVLIFAFCTSAWSTASRALWSHTPSLALLSPVLWLLVRSEERPRSLRPVGVLLGLACVVRLTNLVPAAVIAVWILTCRRRQALPVLLGAAAVALAHLAYRLLAFGHLTTLYMELNRGIYAEHGFPAHLPEALAGTVISPGRGLLVYSPVFIFSVWGAVLAVRRGPRKALAIHLLVILLLHWLLIASYPIWWGGWSYGPRTFTDMVPLFVYFLIPVLTALGAMRGLRKQLLSGLLALLAAVSFLMHAKGATDWETHWWNGVPEDVMSDPSRVWDWRDPPFLRRHRADRLAVEIPQRYRMTMGQLNRAVIAEKLKGAAEHLSEESWEEAHTAATEALRHSWNHPDTHAILAVAAQRMGRNEEATTSWTIALAAYRGPLLHDVFTRAHRHFTAEGLSMAQALARSQASAWRCHEVAEWLLAQGEFSEADTVWAFAIETDPPSEEFHLGRSQCLLRLGRPLEAAEQAAEALALNPDSGWAHLALGDAWDRLGRLGRAQAAWQTCLETEPDEGAHATARANLARAGDLPR